jgi:hypothetical protein
VEAERAEPAVFDPDDTASPYDAGRLIMPFGVPQMLIRFDGAIDVPPLRTAAPRRTTRSSETADHAAT